MKLILGSRSTGRKNLLSYLKIPFTIRVSSIDEEKIVFPSPQKTIKIRAKMKGEDIAAKIKYSNLKEPTLIISADSGAVIQNKLIGKPKNKAEAVKILSLLSGKTHEFITAIYTILLYKNIKTHQISVKKIWQEVEKSYVIFRELTKGDIERYLSLIDYAKYAASYALDSTPQDFIIRIEGSASNVIGLPLEKIIPILIENKLLN
ncbi:hypothetical protein COV53_05705 [Candidatus Gottesmanbacteria bacterium CG11_big_fil_rev_8_21_14_0_20_37_11]|uniref:Nucleoside triphosphate pyrophosphatase n=1 Tax=Candidatus Gottesmanbacteria bacterium CG11_big_fil_rev_8_21_14_0_20_37_11 TaxID=1974575 RepID=A0A2H0NIA9_9BACT|nr:MAG: hypothetical protein COV53_05705 [Candidatus Gottesmanbacteria bacterium CG11_big_fil_rev_8_21_14_0_20_37_11]